jgi:hypothetical protein
MGRSTTDAGKHNGDAAAMVEDEDLRVESVRWRPRRFRERGKTSAREEPTRRSSPSTREALARVLAGEPRPGDGACEADGAL